MSKFLKLEKYKEAFHKTKGMSTKKNHPREALGGDKSKEKRKGEDKQANSPKMQSNRPDKNKGPFLRYTNYQSLTFSVDYIYVVLNRSLRTLSSQKQMPDG